MAHSLVAVRTLHKLNGPPKSVKDVMYDVWVTPNGYGKWKFSFVLAGQYLTDHEECDLQAAEYIFGYEAIEKHFHSFFAKSMQKDEEDIL